MGFDQYHEPPEELPEEARTYARMIASLTEEAEAIGWYPSASRSRDGGARRSWRTRRRRSSSTSGWTSSFCSDGRPSGGLR